jgi:type IV secretion system protein VirB1
MILEGLALAAQIARCTPNVGPRTMAAIVKVESGGDPFAIGDNTTMRSYHPREQAEAEALARRLIGAGHSVDLGIAQIDNANLARVGLNVRTAFNACANLVAEAQILEEDYSLAARYFGAGQVALRHAIGMYNTGRLDAGGAYVRRVLIAAGIRPGRLHPRPRRVAQREGANWATTQVLTGAATSLRNARPRRSAAARAPIIVEKSPPSQVVLQ